jgi:hypothetical protein
MKEGCLFVLYIWDSPNQDAPDHVLGLFGKLSRRMGALAWFHGLWTCDAKVFEYWMIFSLKIKLNRSWKFWRNWNVTLVLLERSWWAGLDGIYLVRFRFRMWEILILKWFVLLKIQINSKNTRFWKQKSVEDVVTLQGLPFNSSMISFHIWLFKKSIHTLQKQCSHAKFPYFVMGSHLGQRHIPH